MTSVSQQTNPNQSSSASSASQSTLSYASTAKKAVSSPPIATGSSSTPSPVVAVGGAAPVQQQHGKSNSISPVNGKPSISPAVPAVSAPAIAHSSSAMNGSNEHHTRKSSVTIPANGMNGGPVGGAKNSIQFGSIADSPKVSHSIPESAQPTASAPITISNPRVTDPSHSPTPIPAPSASGGRPPSVLGSSGNGVAFGSFGGETDRHIRQASGNLAPGNQPSGHIRQTSQPGQGDMSNQSSPAQGRASFQPPAGRGRGGPYNQNYQQQQLSGFPPTNPQFRPQNQGRQNAMAPPFQGQQRPMQSYNNSPGPARSPALAPSMPGTPNANPAMPMQNYGGYQQHQQQQYMQNPNVQPPSSFVYREKSYPSTQSRNKNKKSKNHEQYSKNRHGRQEPTRELFAHEYMPNERYYPDSEGNGHIQSRNFGPMEQQMAHQYPMPHQHEMHMPSAPWNNQASVDQSHMSPLSPSLQHATSMLPSQPPISSTPFDVSKIDLSPSSGDFDKFLTMKQSYYQQPPFDARMQMQGAPFMYPQMANMSYMGGPPQSPQAGFQMPNNYQPAYVPGQYAQAQPMSRNSSQMSEQRPSSSMGQPQTPSMTPSMSHANTPQPKAASTPSTTFSRPTRKSAAIVIRRPDGEALDVDSIKAPASPAPSINARTRTPPIAASSTPTPPPKPSTPQHGRTDSASINTKTSEERRTEMMEKVRKEAEKAAAEKQAKEGEAAKAAEAKEKEAQKLLEEAKAKEAAELKAKEEADAKAAADKAKQDEEEALEAQIREMEEADAAREKKDAEMEIKRKAEKAAAEEANKEKRKAEAEENDRKLQEAEREVERLEDEREKKRAEADAKAGEKLEEKKDTKEVEKNAPTTPSTLASKLSSLTLGTDSGTSTPGSDDSMGPPPKINAAEKRGKPAALNLAPLNTNSVEPPQPSAALQSLKSARFLTVLNSSIYPPNISSPNPALNSAVTTKGKSFKYDKEFLLQFQKVFTEKPSMEFESQIKALIGDGDGGSARTSTRTPGGMGPRQNSTRNNPPGAFAMGSFGAPGGKTLPPGTTSEMRFAMASGTMARPPVQPMASFNRPGGAFPGGNSMQRTPSSSNMSNAPHSPRQQSRRGQGSKREYNQGNAKAEAQAAKTMPLTAGMDLKPIKVSETGWKPRSIGQSQSATGAAGPTPGAQGGTGHMEPDMVQRKVKAALNKMTPEKFDKIADQILVISAQSKDEADGRTLRQVIQLTFEKATDEAHWASMYAKFCKRMLETMSPDIKDESILDKNGNIVSGGNLFRKYLLNRCQEEFERGWKMDLPDKPEGERGEEKTEEAVMLSDEYYVAAAAKRRGLGLVQFIGELYKLSMLTERIMHECVKKLVDYTGIPDEAEIESLTKLLKTIGANLDSTEKGKPIMDVYFQRIQSMIDTPELPSRLRFMLMDIVDLRKKGWQSKEMNKGPKTLDEVRVEAEAAIAQKAAENARGSQRGGGGGGGRMAMGRGDGRNFSNQYGNQPPVDYQKNTVGMDDLRRLTNKNTNRASSQQMSFGPTSMFSSRSNSGRKMGPGGSLSRGGEDSGASSRTGTPPQQKEKESATSANAFSLLAGLGSGDHDPTSPPSTSVSPALSKATPAHADKSDDK